MMISGPLTCVHSEWLNCSSAGSCGRACGYLAWVPLATPGYTGLDEKTSLCGSPRNDAPRELGAASYQHKNLLFTTQSLVVFSSCNSSCSINPGTVV